MPGAGDPLELKLVLFIYLDFKITIPCGVGLKAVYINKNTRMKITTEVKIDKIQ